MQVKGVILLKQLYITEFKSKFHSSKPLQMLQNSQAVVTAIVTY